MISITFVGDVFFDALGIEQTAVTQRDTLLLGVEGHLGVVLNALFQQGFGEKKTLDQLFADDVAFDDLFGIFGSDLNVENVVRHDLDDGALSAETEAAGLDDADVVLKTVFFDVLVQIVHQLLSVGGMAAGTAAAEDIFFNGVDVVSSGATESQLALGGIVCAVQSFLRGDLVHSLTLLLVFVDDFHRFGGGNFAVNFAVDHHNRSKTASTDAAECVNGKQTVGGGVGISLNTQDALKFTQNGFGTLHIAGSTHADIDVVLAFGLGGEVVVETDHTGNLGFREEKFLGDMDLDFPGKISEDILCAVQNLDQPSAAAFIVAVNSQTVDESIEFCEFGSCSLRQFVATHFFQPFVK